MRRMITNTARLLGALALVLLLVEAALYALDLMQGSGVYEPVTIQLILKLVWLFIMAGMVFGLLRLRDWMVGVDFKQVMGGIKNDAMAAAVYYGLSVLGVCLMFGLYFS